MFHHLLDTNLVRFRLVAARRKLTLTRISLEALPPVSPPRERPARRAIQTTWFPDLDTQSMIASGDHVRSVGWLDRTHPYTMGAVSDGFLTKLAAFAKLSGQSTEALGWPVTAGFHTCEFCGHANGYLNFGVPAGKLLYVAPEMIVHYVGQHDYTPPAEFIDAVMMSPLPDTPEYRESAATFRT